MYNLFICRDCNYMCLVEEGVPIERKNEETGESEVILLCKKCYKKEEEK